MSKGGTTDFATQPALNGPNCAQRLQAVCRVTNHLTLPAVLTLTAVDENKSALPTHQPSTFGIILTILTESELCHPDKNPHSTSEINSPHGLGRQYTIAIGIRLCRSRTRHMVTASGSPQKLKESDSFLF